jgi:sugar porter (SP) family MFS transporter
MKWWREQFSTGYKNSEGELDISPDQAAQIVSILSAGTFFGALGAAPFADHLGRRISLILAVIVFTVGVILQTVSLHIPLFISGRYVVVLRKHTKQRLTSIRFLAGVGVGNISVLVPLYQSEMAPKWIRGTLVCAYQLAITFGLLIAAVVNNFTATINNAASFRIPIATQLVWAGILFLGLLILPETPRYLIKRERHEAAAASLSRIRRLDITHPALIEELAEIEANHSYELSLGPSTYRDVFLGSPHLGRRVLTGCGLQILQQLTGCNFIFYYGTTFFSRNGLGTPFMMQLVTNSVNVLSTLPGMVLVETWGRRRLLLVGATGMAFSQLLVAIVGTAMPSTYNANMVLIVFVCLYIFFFAASWGPTAWVVTSEIYPLKVRAKSMSISTSSNWLLNFAIAYGTPYMIGEGNGYANLGPKVFFVWGTFCFFAILFVWTMVFETSKISLEQIDELYERVEHAWNSEKFEPSWSFQDIREETTNGMASGVSLADREAARRRAEAESPTSGHGHHGHSGDSDRITVSADGSHSQTSSAAMTEEDKIVANLGHVDFSL